MNKMDEKILVVDRYDLFRNESLTFQGVLTGGVAFDHFMEKFNAYKEVRRGDAEENSAWKQPIPYVVLKRGDEVFLYKRLSGGGETRLHNQLSIGVGGHMNPFHYTDDWDSNLMINAYREMNEELHFNVDLEDVPRARVIGLINDDNDPAGLFHIGILMLLELPEDAEVTVRETEQLEGCWVSTNDLLKSDVFGRLETWSQFAICEIASRSKNKYYNGGYFI